MWKYLPLVFAALWLSAAPAQDAPLLVEFDRRSDGIFNPDPTPLLRVYADGLVVVHRPPHHVDAGTWTLQLQPAALDALSQDLSSSGLLDLDPTQLEAAIRQAAQAKRATTRPTYRSETIITRFHLPGATTTDELRLRNLLHLARELPNVAALARLADTERKLLALSRHPALERATAAEDDR